MFVLESHERVHISRDNGGTNVSMLVFFPHVRVCVWKSDALCAGATVLRLLRVVVDGWRVYL